MKGSGKGYKNSKYEMALNELEEHIKRLDSLFPSRFQFAKSKDSIDVNSLFICEKEENEETANLSSSLDKPDKDSSDNEEKLVIDERNESESSEKNQPFVTKKVTPDLGQSSHSNNGGHLLFPDEQSNLEIMQNQPKRQRKRKPKVKSSVNQLNQDSPNVVKRKTSGHFANTSVNDDKTDLDNLMRKYEFEKMMHQEEIKEIKHNYDLILRYSFNLI